MTNTTGVLDKDGKLLTGLTASEIDALFADGTIHGGMLPKIGSALDAVKNGVKSSHIIDGRVEHALLLEVLTNEGVGTMIRADGTPPRYARPDAAAAIPSMATKPGERRLQILQTLAAMLENPRGEKVTTAALAAQARRFRGRALPALRQQGADVRGPDRVHRDDAVLAGQQDRARETADGVAQAEQIVAMLLGFAEKNPGMTRVLIGDALVNEDERLQARMNQLYDSSRRRCASRCASRRPPTRGTATRRPTPRVLIAFVVGRWQLFAKSGFKRPPQDGWDLQRKFLFG